MQNIREVVQNFQSRLNHRRGLALQMAVLIGHRFRQAEVMHSALTITFRVQRRSCPRCTVTSSSRYLHKFEVQRDCIRSRALFIVLFNGSTIYLQYFLRRETRNESWFAYIQIIVSQTELPVCIISPTVHFPISSQSECMLQTDGNVSGDHRRNRFNLTKTEKTNK